MRQVASILILSFLSIAGFGQVKGRDLIGEWQTVNYDSLYYYADTIRFVKNTNRSYNRKASSLIQWSIGKRSFVISNVFTFTESGRVSEYKAKGRLRLSKSDFGQIITLERNGQQLERFKIVNYQEEKTGKYSHEIEEIGLVRFDRLSEYKLYKYVDSLIYKVLKYDSTLVEPTGLNILSNGDNKSIRIRNLHVRNKEPLIVINRHVLIDKEILKRFRLVETLEITYLPKETSTSIYGLRALNGVIILIVSKRRFKEIWKKYGK